MNKKFTPAIAIAIIIPIIVALFVIYFVQANKSNEENTVNSSTPTVTSEQVQVELNDTDLIKEALVLKNDWNPNDIEVTITSNEGKFAKGMVGPVGGGPGGGLFFAALVNGEWEIVWDGNGITDCASLEAYPDYPTDLIPQCYDSSTGQMIER